MTNPRIGNAGIFGLSTFGFALAMLGFQLAVSEETAGATLFAILVAALGESLAGLWLIARGDSYLAGVLTTFGLWLIGYYFFLTSDPAARLLTPKSNGLYVLVLVIPVAMMAIPPFRQRKSVLALAFVSLIAMLLAVGLGSYFGRAGLETVGGWLAFVSALFVWYLAWQEIDEATRAVTPPLAGAPPTATQV